MRLRRLLVVTFLAIVLPVGAASLAYACTALATLTVNTGSAAPGQTITGTGKGFNGGGHGTPAGGTPVELRWNTRNGPVVATAPLLDAAGNISFSFAVPNVPAGQYVLIGVQTNPATGTPFYGTPARQAVRIVATVGSSKTETEPVLATAEEPAVIAAPVAARTDVVPSPAQPSLIAESPVVPALVTPPSARQALTTNPSPAATATVSAVQPLAVPSVSETSTAAPVAVQASTPSAANTAAFVTTNTPSLAASTSGSAQSSALPALALMLLGLGIGVAATARVIKSRIPLARRQSSIATA